MTKADTIFKENIRKIMEEGVWSEQARPKYKDGRTANPSTSREPLWSLISQKASSLSQPFVPSRLNQLSKRCSGSTRISRIAWIFLEDKYNVHYWNDWEVGDSRTIGQRYGAVVKSMTLRIRSSNN